MTARKARQDGRWRLDDSIRYGHLQLAINVLGYAALAINGRAHIVTELSGKSFIVTLRDDAPYCLTCKSDNDDHTSLVRLYRARIGKHGLGA